MKALMRLAVLVAAFVMSAMGSTLRADYYEDYCDYTDPHTVKETYYITPGHDPFVGLSLPRKFKVCCELIDWERQLGDRSVYVNVGGLGSVLVNRNYPSFMTHEDAMPGYSEYHLTLTADWGGDRDWVWSLEHSQVEIRVTFFYQTAW